MEESKPSPQPPMSPLNQQQHSNMSAPLSMSSDIDSNSQFSPPPAVLHSIAPATSTTTTTTAIGDNSNSSTEIKRNVSIQEMREIERRKREEKAGKINMNEQHTLFAQFEQELKPS